MYTSILVASIAQFVLGAIWYSPLMFGKYWMQIMEFSGTKEEMEKAQKEMIPFYLLQLLLTLIFTWELYQTLNSGTSLNPYFLAFMMWFGYVMPTQVSAVIWSNTKKIFWKKQIFIMLGCSLVSMMLATFIILNI